MVLLALAIAGPAKSASDPGALALLRQTALKQRLQGNLVEAGRTLDRALGLAPGDAGLWVDIGRLRYAGGEHVRAIEAADRAIALDPRNVRALEFRGQIVRDQFGLRASLPWFEAALEADPHDASVLGEYAATLGDLGEARAMLTVTRRLLEKSPGNPRALFLQAVLAARADRIELARRLLDRVSGAQRETPAVLLLEGVLHLRAGNFALARAPLERLAVAQPANPVAQDLLAKALFFGGDYKGVIERFAPVAEHADASAYLLILVARAHEALGQRGLAAPLLDRAARPADVLVPVSSSWLGALIDQRRLDDADRAAGRNLEANSGSAVFQLQAGDAAMANRRFGDALDHYRASGRIRLSNALVQRAVLALVAADRVHDGRALVNDWIAQNPAIPAAIRLAADFGTLATDGERRRRLVLLDHLCRQAGDRDLGLLLDLANARMDVGDVEGAVEVAAAAYRLQRSSMTATRIYALALSRQNAESPLARALQVKLTRMSP